MLWLVELCITHWLLKSVSPKPRKARGCQTSVSLKQATLEQPSLVLFWPDLAGKKLRVANMSWFRWQKQAFIVLHCSAFFISVSLSSAKALWIALWSKNYKRLFCGSDTFCPELQNFLKKKKFSKLIGSQFFFNRFCSSEKNLSQSFHFYLLVRFELYMRIFSKYC